MFETAAVGRRCCPPFAQGTSRRTAVFRRARSATVAVRCQSSGGTSVTPADEQAAEEVATPSAPPTVFATAAAAGAAGAGPILAKGPAGTQQQQQQHPATGNSNGHSRLGPAAAPQQANGSAAVKGQHEADAQEQGSLPAGPLPAAAAAAEAEAGAEEDAAGEPYSLASKVALAGGVLDLVRLEGSRMLRVWMPPGYSREEAARHPYPLLLLNDGQNLFEDRLSFSGCSWRAAEAAAALIAAGEVPPFLICGIDHAGTDRSLEYLPYKPGAGPGGFRKDAQAWPGGGVGPYLERVFGEVLPWVQSAYGAATDPARIAFGGSSFGGICALWACMHHGDKFGAALVESPSLWFADERFFREDLPEYRGPWPQRLFLAMGSAEYTGIRPAEEKEAGQMWDELLVQYCRELAELLGSEGLDATRLKWEIGEGAAHTEAAWAARLPDALRFLAAPWWEGAAAAQEQNLFFTSPRKLQAGHPAVLFVNKAKSHPLVDIPGPLHIRFGFNNWGLEAGEQRLLPAPQLEAALPAAAAAGEAAGTPGPAARREGSSGEPTWQSVSFVVPPTAWEMNFVLTDGNGRFDNNAGADFYLRVRLPQDSAAAGSSPEAARAAASAAAQGPVDAIAARSTARLFFTSPEVLVAGASARLYFNRARSMPLRSNPNIKAHMGFNHWELAMQEQHLAPASLWQDHNVDWWATQTFQVPEAAFDLTFCFTDGHGLYDSNEGLNYTVPVSRPGETVPPRSIASSQVVDHAGGELHIITLNKRAGTDKAAKEARWTEEKVIRVWTPPGYSKDATPPGGWPVLWLCDGSNKFEDHLAHQGCAWNVGYCAEGLIRNGTLPPFVVAAVDSAGPMRSLNYLPYRPGTGVGGFRGDAERWPGGGCEGYMRRVVQELMPLVAQEFATATAPHKVAFGGGSFAGVTALYCAQHYPHVFGAVLAESPSLWIAEGRFLEDMWAYKGALPERIFVGCGTKEYSATRDHEREDIDALLLHYYKEAARALEAAGMRGPQRLRFLIEEGAGHHEKAWAWRLSGALAFLLSPWWDE